MTEFIFMLTDQDVTVPDAVAVYEQVRGSGLRHVGFKDIGASPETLARLTATMHADGRTVYLEVVSVTAEDELRSIQAAVEIGVDVVMGGTHPAAALPLLAGRNVRYYPFAGRVTGHPSILGGSPSEIAADVATLTATPGIDGIDLLAYRHPGDVPAIIAAAVTSSRGPVVVAGSIDSRERIATVARLGAWGFTIGGAIFERRLPGGRSIREQVDWTLDQAADVADLARTQPTVEPEPEP